MACQYNNIVVRGADGSDIFFSALKWVVQEVKTYNTILEILCCYQEPTYPGHRGNVGLTEDDARKVIGKALGKTADAGVDAQASLKADNPTLALSARLRRVARIVVEARDGSGEFADRLLGSVVPVLSARAFCVAIVVPSTAARDILPVRHVMCGVGGSRASKIALGFAMREAARRRAELSRVSVINLGGSTWVSGPRYHQGVLDDVHAGLRDTAMKAAEGYNIDTHCYMIGGGLVALFAEFSTVVGMLMVGARGRGGSAGLPLGLTN